MAADRESDHLVEQGSAELVAGADNLATAVAGPAVVVRDRIPLVEVGLPVFGYPFCFCFRLSVLKLS